jgi:predicted phosphodiesterase
MSHQDTILKHMDEHPGSRIGYARILNQYYPDSTVKAWEMRLINYESANKDDDYIYDESSDTYTTTLTFGDIVMTGEKHRAMLRDYSGFDGKALTGSEMAIKYDMPVEHFYAWRRAHGVTHTTVPLTNEQLLDEPEQHIDDLLAHRKHNAAQEIYKRERKSLEEDAVKWRDLDFKLKYLKDLPKASTKVPKLKLPVAPSPYALVVCPTDFHWGKGGWEDEVGETYNFEEARKRLMEKTESLVSRIPSAPEKIYVGAGSDWFHVDNDQGTTTKGTLQDMCGSPAEILITGCKLAREHIDLMRQIAPVEIVMMAGNHDRHSTIALMMYLSAAYEGCDDVTVTISSFNRRYLVYGATLLGFTHGDGLKKTNGLAGLMANEAKKEWGQTDHRVWFHGHLHHQRLTEKDGCLIVQMPSLAGHDRYHARAGYTTSTAGLAAYLIDEKEGYIGSLFAPVVHEE